MGHRTAHPPATAGLDERPPDLDAMRATARRLLGPDGAPDALPPAADEVNTLTLGMRGQLELLIPDLERAVGGRPTNIAQYCALACIGEARGKLSVQPRPGYEYAVAYARRLARVLNALADHYERLAGGTS
ncbi:MAG: hypothetical protein HOW71_24975 [Nonomuraea sp.]|nr:hypothetical protein [Nonomuraea sp.]NUQ96410.1 hypothetical protein [Streptomyces sp.]NUS10430.1 hypothetical protein [Streptomyces sp.]